MSRRRVPSLIFLAATWLVSTGALFGGCDGLFRPAVPEAPSSVEPVRTNFSEPDSTLATLARGLESKGQNNGSQVYLEALADDPAAGSVFRAYFDLTDSLLFAQSGGTVPSWGKSNESFFFSQIVQDVRPTDTFRMTWEPDLENPRDDFTDTEATIHRRYVLHADAEGGSSIIIAVGYADLLFYRSTEGKWLIVRWSDRRDPAADPDDVNQITLGARRLELQS
jgi:hypothetical protein